MEMFVVSLGILDPLYNFFGYIMRILYDIFNNYGVVIIIFTIFLRLLLMPLSIKSYSGTIKQQAMNKELEDIKRRYGHDKERLQQAQQELYMKHGFSPLSGCLPMILQLVIIWPVYRIISAPLVHIMGVDVNNIGKLVKDKDGNIFVDGITKIVHKLGLITETQALSADRMNIPIINVLNDNAKVLHEVIQKGLLKINQLIDLNFLGLNLGLNPTYNPKILFGDEMSTYLPLIIIPILAVITTWLSMKVTQWTAPNRKALEEEKARAKKNPAKQDQTPQDPAAGMGKGMTWFMPLFTLWITFTMPAAMGLYWVIGNLMAMAQQYIFYYFIGKRTRADEAGAA